MSDSNFATLAKNMILEDGPSITEMPSSDNQICYFPKYFTMTSRTGLQNTFHELNEMIQLYKRKSYNRSLIALTFTELLIKASREHFWTELKMNNRENSKPIVKVHELLNYLHQNYPQKITSETIERDMECNFDYLNRTFSKLTGQTIIRYLNQVRINHARELIEATPMNLSEIGYLVGLSDPFYFSKVFKKYTGLSPKHYYLKVRGMG